MDQAEEIRRAAEAVLNFWFVETPPEKRFAKDPLLDQAIAERFSALVDRVGASEATGWRDDPRCLLAAIVLLDQFPRNLNRGRAAAFAHDVLARSLTEIAIAHGWGDAMRPEERQFLYMPLMHSESLADQERAVAIYDGIGVPEAARFARLHLDQIARFGRFPGRNDALGRESTAEEHAFLEQPGSRF